MVAELREKEGTCVALKGSKSRSTVGVDVGDGTTTVLFSVLSNIAMGCIVLGRQVNVDFATNGCPNATPFVGMAVRFCTMKIHDSMFKCKQTMISIVVHHAFV